MGNQWDLGPRNLSRADWNSPRTVSAAYAKSNLNLGARALRLFLAICGGISWDEAFRPIRQFSVVGTVLLLGLQSESQEGHSLFRPAARQLTIPVAACRCCRRLKCTALGLP